MKILRAIGAFFAKIGRWIANTAWVQPLLIVGGIFAIIFSIPYIKKGIEGLSYDSSDSKYEWYKGRALSLAENGAADKLLSYLEEYKAGDADLKAKIKSTVGIGKNSDCKFFLSFVQKDCQNCKDAVEGYTYTINAGYAKGFKMVTFLVDKTNDDGDNIAQPIYSKHDDLFYDIACTFSEDAEDYPLFNNLIKKDKSSKVDELKAQIAKLPEASTSEEGLDTPLTLLVDLEKIDEGYFGSNGVTQVLFNYIDFDYSSTNNAATKATVIRDIWNYQGLFDPEFDD